MQKIVIKKFGPLQEIDLDVKDVMLFIGSQATGKSTIAKTIFFFKSLKDDLYKFFVESFEKNNFDKPLGSFARAIRQKFLNYYGASTYLENIELQYFYSQEVWIKIDLEKNNKFITPQFSKIFRDFFNELSSDIQSFAQKYHSRNISLLSSKDLQEMAEQKNYFFKKMLETCEGLFQDSRELIFIPAGRSLLAVLSEQLQNIKTRNLDFLTRNFLEKISLIRPFFRKSLQEISMERKEFYGLEKEQIKRLDLAIATIEKILKGRYQSDIGGERIFYSKNQYVKLNFASSGQQEILWILLLLFLAILEGKSVFVVIEEPEAHLFPETQKEIVNLIALLVNQTASQVIITTHSPYILASLNNLMLAHRAAKFNPEKVAEKISKEFWLENSLIYAGLVEKGKINDILDKELHFIQQEKLDAISQVINEEFDFLFQIENS